MNATLSVQAAAITPNVVMLPIAPDLKYDATLDPSTVKLSGGLVVDGINEVKGNWKITNKTLPDVPGGYCSVIFEPSDSKTYNMITGRTIYVNVAKGEIKFTKKPKATDITYGQTLGESQLTEWETSIGRDGQLIWENQSIVPTVEDSGRTKYTYIFVPNNTRNYNIITDQATVKVNKLQSVPITPNNKMSASQDCQTVSEVPLPFGWEWRSADQSKSIRLGDTVSAVAQYTASDKGNYEKVEITVAITRQRCFHNKTRYDSITAKAATCEKSGYSGDIICTQGSCGVVDYGYIIEKTGHTYNTYVKQACTATQTGIRTYTCKSCFSQYDDEIPTIYHDGYGRMTLKPLVLQGLDRGRIIISDRDIQTAISSMLDGKIIVDLFPQDFEGHAVDQVEVSLSRSSLRQLASSAMKELRFHTDFGEITLDKAAITKMNEATTTLDTMFRLTGDSASAKRPDFTVAIQYLGSTITSIPGGQMSVAIPYVKQRVNQNGEVSSNGTVELAERIKGLKLQSGGKYKQLSNAYYNESEQKVVITTNETGTYAVGYYDPTIETDRESSIIKLTGKANKTSISLYWNEIEDVDGYMIYGSKVGNSYKLLATVKDKTSYSVKNLKKGTAYKYKIVGYRNQSGGKFVVSTSFQAAVVTTGGTYGNQKDVKVTPEQVTIKKGSTYQLNVTYKKTAPLRSIFAMVRYQSSNPGVAKVSSSGKITALDAGSCYINIYTQNGYQTRMEVTVTP